MKKGTLYLIPSFIGEADVNLSIPAYNIEVTSKIKCFIVEEIRSARRFLKKIIPDLDIPSLRFIIYNEHSDKMNVSEFIQPLLEGQDVGILSEAGVPCVADPGSEIVRTAHFHKIKVIPLAGPSSILLALMASGFNGQNFIFHGYLPADKLQRVKKIRELEKQVTAFDQTQIFMETPYRNIQLFRSLMETCREDTQLCIATGLMTQAQFIRTAFISDWKNQEPPIHKNPAIFLLYR